MKRLFAKSLILFTILSSSIVYSTFGGNKLEEVGSMKTILGDLGIYAVWTEDLVDPQAATGLIIGSKNVIILVRPEYMGDFVDGLEKAIEKSKPVYKGPKLTEKQKIISKVPIKFNKNYEAEIKWLPRTEESKEGVVYINFLHEGKTSSKESVSLMMYNKQASVFIKAMQKALGIAKKKAAESKL